jgi:putative thioredoxin
LSPARRACYGAPPSIDAQRMIIDVTEASFETEVLAASQRVPVLVDFWAEWCPPCRALTPVLERVVRASGGELRLAKIEADDNMRLAGRYQLRGFPTVILFVAGAEVGRFSSARSEEWVRAFLAKHIAAPAADARLVDLK